MSSGHGQWPAAHARVAACIHLRATANVDVDITYLCYVGITSARSSTLASGSWNQRRKHRPDQHAYGHGTGHVQLYGVRQLAQTTFTIVQVKYLGSAGWCFSQVVDRCLLLQIADLEHTSNYQIWLEMFDLMRSTVPREI